MPVPEKPSGHLSLVGDIGGTNCRLALVEFSGLRPTLIDPQNYICADHGAIEDVIRNYLDGRPQPKVAVIAVAGAVQDGVAVSTNADWHLSEAGLRGCGLQVAKVINDYTALALCIDHLGPEDLTPIGARIAVDRELTLAVLGAGTGFGVSALVRGLGEQIPIATEGGHVSFAPTDLVEIEILKILRERFDRVSVERLLSGPGLVNIHSALARLNGLTPSELSPQQIVEQSRLGDDLASQTIERFCAIYGDVAGDLALAFGARGGVYLCGGIAPRLAVNLQEGAFRRRFEAKGRFQAYMATIPTHIVTHPYAALLGSAALARSLQSG